VFNESYLPKKKLKWTHLLKAWQILTKVYCMQIVDKYWLYWNYKNKLFMCEVCQWKRRVNADSLCELFHEMWKSSVKNFSVNLILHSVLVKCKIYFQKDCFLQLPVLMAFYPK
jgi:hypothetical protein